MKLYLVQHAEAHSRVEDPERPLTEQGREDVARIAAFARRAGIHIHQIRHSGKRRAEETAALLAEQLQPEGGVSALSGLAPEDDIRPIAELLRRETQPLMLVGHLPFMQRLAGHLVAGDRDRPVVRFQKGGIVCLERDPGSGDWSICWAVVPELFLGDAR